MHFSLPNISARHSLASNLVNSGVSLFKVSKLLGHSSMKMTERYAHSDIESLRADIEKISLNGKGGKGQIVKGKFRIEG